MSNPNTPFGLLPSRRRDGTTGNFQTSQATIVYNNANSFGVGDVVKQASGVIDKAATTDANIFGVLADVSYNDAANPGVPPVRRAWLAPTLASTTTVTAQVWTDPNLVFRVRANGSVAASQIGLNAKFTSNGAPNTTSGLSTLALDTAAIGVTSTYPLRILGFAADINNDPTSAYAVLEVSLNTQAFLLPTGQ